MAGIADLLKEVATSTKVKCVLSSRPLPAFVGAFKHCPNLRLQDLTYNDITTYVNNKVKVILE